MVADTRHRGSMDTFESALFWRDKPVNTQSSIIFSKQSQFVTCVFGRLSFAARNGLRCTCAAFRGAWLFQHVLAKVGATRELGRHNDAEKQGQVTTAAAREYRK